MSLILLQDRNFSRTIDSSTKYNSKFLLLKRIDNLFKTSVREFKKSPYLELLSADLPLYGIMIGIIIKLRLYPSLNLQVIDRTIKLLTDSKKKIYQDLKNHRKVTLINDPLNSDSSGKEQQIKETLQWKFKEWSLINANLYQYTTSCYQLAALIEKEAQSRNNNIRDSLQKLVSKENVYISTKICNALGEVFETSGALNFIPQEQLTQFIGQITRYLKKTDRQWNSFFLEDHVSLMLNNVPNNAEYPLKKILLRLIQITKDIVNLSFDDMQEKSSKEGISFLSIDENIINALNLNERNYLKSILEVKASLRVIVELFKKYIRPDHQPGIFKFTSSEKIELNLITDNIRRIVACREDLHFHESIKAESKGRDLDLSKYPLTSTQEGGNQIIDLEKKDKKKISKKAKTFQEQALSNLSLNFNKRLKYNLHTLKLTKGEITDQIYNRILRTYIKSENFPAGSKQESGRKIGISLVPNTELITILRKKARFSDILSIVTETAREKSNKLLNHLTLLYNFYKHSLNHTAEIHNKSYFSKLKIELNDFFVFFSYFDKVLEPSIIRGHEEQFFLPAIEKKAFMYNQMFSLIQVYNQKVIPLLKDIPTIERPGISPINIRNIFSLYYPYLTQIKIKKEASFISSKFICDNLLPFSQKKFPSGNNETYPGYKIMINCFFEGLQAVLLQESRDKDKVGLRVYSIDLKNKESSSSLKRIIVTHEKNIPSDARTLLEYIVNAKKEQNLSSLSWALPIFSTFVSSINQFIAGVPAGLAAPVCLPYQGLLRLLTLVKNNIKKEISRKEVGNLSLTSGGFETFLNYFSIENTLTKDYNQKEMIRITLKENTFLKKILKGVYENTIFKDTSHKNNKGQLIPTVKFFDIDPLTFFNGVKEHLFILQDKKLPFKSNISFEENSNIRDSEVSKEELSSLEQPFAEKPLQEPATKGCILGSYLVSCDSPELKKKMFNKLFKPHSKESKEALPFSNLFSFLLQRLLFFPRFSYSNQNKEINLLCLADLSSYYNLSIEELLDSDIYSFYQEKRILQIYNWFVLALSLKILHIVIVREIPLIKLKGIYNNLKFFKVNLDSEKGFIQIFYFLLLLDQCSFFHYCLTVMPFTDNKLSTIAAEFKFILKKIIVLIIAYQAFAILLLKKEIISKTLLLLFLNIIFPFLIGYIMPLNYSSDTIYYPNPEGYLNFREPVRDKIILFSAISNIRDMVIYARGFLERIVIQVYHTLFQSGRIRDISLRIRFCNLLTSLIPTSDFIPVTITGLSGAGFRAMIGDILTGREGSLNALNFSIKKVNHHIEKLATVNSVFSYQFTSYRKSYFYNFDKVFDSEKKILFEDYDVIMNQKTSTEGLFLRLIYIIFILTFIEVYSQLPSRSKKIEDKR